MVISINIIIFFIIIIYAIISIMNFFRFYIKVNIFFYSIIAIFIIIDDMIIININLLWSNNIFFC